MIPEIDLGPIELQTFGLCLALAFLADGLLVGRRLRELGKPPDWAWEAIFAAAVGGIIGARVDWLIQNWDEVSGDLLGNVFTGAGLVFFGGLIGGAIGVTIWGLRRGFSLLALADLAAPAIALGYAIGRIGCQLAGDGDYGVASDLPWAMAYPDGTVPTTEEVHPTPVYETIVMGLVTWFIWRMRGRYRDGTLMALYLVLGGLERFLVEFIRRNPDAVAGLTIPQVVSLVMIAGGGALLARGIHAPGGEPVGRSARA